MSWQYAQLVVTYDRSPAAGLEAARSIIWQGPGQGVGENISDSDETILQFMNRFGAAHSECRPALREAGCRAAAIALRRSARPVRAFARDLNRQQEASLPALAGPPVPRRHAGIATRSAEPATPARTSGHATVTTWR
jgi:hypothetical protein